jgi:hypothetical protein
MFALATIRSAALEKGDVAMLGQRLTEFCDQLIVLQQGRSGCDFIEDG